MVDIMRKETLTGWEKERKKESQAKNKCRPSITVSSGTYRKNAADESHFKGRGNYIKENGSQRKINRTGPSVDDTKQCSRVAIRVEFHVQVMEVAKHITSHISNRQLCHGSEYCISEFLETRPCIQQMYRRMHNVVMQGYISALFIDYSLHLHSPALRATP